uniref:Cyclin N-terminal domain-containing protein n=1 Tax=Eutreptiella gymnastica TaxID=73025 RepID=A0A7S4G1J6_9EUGL
MGQLKGGGDLWITGIHTGMMSGRTPLGDIGNILKPNIGWKHGDKCKPVVSTAVLSPRVDVAHKRDQLYVVEYAQEIMEYLRDTEDKHWPSPDYMARQDDINEKMRAILVDWLVDVHLKFKLLPETLYLAASLIDRFLDQKTVTRQKLQLVGVVAMFIGAKYEEIYPPEIKDFIYISANTYTKDEIMRMERLMLTSLGFNITVPTAYPFIKRSLQVINADRTSSLLALYISELALLDYSMLVYLPSTVAAACVYLARLILQNPEPWNWTLEYYTRHAPQTLMPCVVQLYDLVQGARNHKCQAIRKKYSYAKYGGVSAMTDVRLVFP